MAEVRTIGLETFRSLIREVAGEVISEMQLPAGGGMAEQDEIVAVDVEEIPADDMAGPVGGMEAPFGGEEVADADAGVEGGFDLEAGADADIDGGVEDVDLDGGAEGVMDMDLSTPEGVADALEDLADMLARAADAVEDVVSTEGGDFDDMETADYALGEARRLVRRARKSVLRENARKGARKPRRNR